jgi:hypothetical protein
MFRRFSISSEAACWFDSFQRSVAALSGAERGEQGRQGLLPDAEAAPAPAGAQHAAFPQRLADHHEFPELAVPARRLFEPIGPEQELGRHELRLRDRAGPDGQHAQLIETSDGLIGLPADRFLGEFQREAMQELTLNRRNFGRLIRNGPAHPASDLAREPERPLPPRRGAPRLPVQRRQNSPAVR